MSVPGARIGRFVRAARSLLLLQLVAALIAVALGVWAVFAVRDLATERDQLRDRVAVLEAQGPAAAAPVTSTPAGPAASPLDTEVRPPAILPVPIPVTESPADVNLTEPADPATEPTPTPPGTTTPTDPNCAGPNVTDPRCRRGRWVRPELVPRRPTAPVVQQPQQDGPRPN